MKRARAKDARREHRKGLTDEQASAQEEYMTNSGEEGSKMGSVNPGTSNQQDKKASSQMSSGNEENEQGKGKTSISGAEGEGDENSFGQYQEAYNPAGMNTSRSDKPETKADTSDSEEALKRAQQHAGRTEAGDYRNRNVGYSNRGHGGAGNEGGGYFEGHDDPGRYQGANQSFPNQDRYDPGQDYNDLRNNPDHENKDRGDVDPDRGGYEEGGGYDHPMPSSDDETRREEMRKKRDKGGEDNRYGAAPEDEMEAKRDYGSRSNYDSPETGNSAPSSGHLGDAESSSEKGDFKRKRTPTNKADDYNDPYRDYNWSSPKEDEQHKCAWMDLIGLTIRYRRLDLTGFKP